MRRDAIFENVPKRRHGPNLSRMYLSPSCEERVSRGEGVDAVPEHCPEPDLVQGSASFEDRWMRLVKPGSARTMQII